MADWKGMLKKGVEAAKSAKTELEKAGVIGDKGAGFPAPGGAAGTASVDEGTLDEGTPRDRCAAILEPGHANPFNLLSTPEVAEVLVPGGAALAEPELAASDADAGPWWRWADRGRHSSLTLWSYSGEAHLDQIAECQDVCPPGDLRPIAGVGEEALLGPGILLFAQGPERLMLVADLPDGADREGPLLTLSRKVLARLPAPVPFADRVAELTPSGDVNLALLVTREEFAQLVARPVRRGEPSRDEREVSLRFDSADGNYGLTLSHSLTNEWFEADPDATGPLAEAIQGMKAAFAALVKPVAGISEEVVISDGQIGFRKGGQVVGIKLTGPDGWDNSPHLLHLARQAATRI